MNSESKLMKCGLYIHIPFCIKKCKYCDFLSFSCEQSDKERYVEALCKEISMKASLYAMKKSIFSVYIGGGTPSILDEGLITKIINCINKEYDLTKVQEVTIEVNPGTVNIQKLATYKRLGINRLSIGLQSADDEQLRAIGRIHSYEQFLKVYNDARTVGFDNINIDVMSALPFQTLASYEDTLNKVIELHPEHISSYSLILEEGTPLLDEYNNSVKQGIAMLPDEATEREMYYITDEKLKAAGYHRYEISNYALKGYESKHNSLYWTGDYYIGYGLGASSMINNERIKNIADIKKYNNFYENAKAMNIEKITNEMYEEYETLTLKDQMEEYMYLGLRMAKGISIEGFRVKFDKDIFDVYGNILKKYQGTKHISIKGDNIRLTKKGIDVSNTVFTDFILE